MPKINEMIFPIFEIFSFLFLSVLQISILLLIMKRKNRQHNETIFGFFTFTAFVWNFSVFISHISLYLYTQANVVEQIFNITAIVGFTMLHPLAVHTLINFIETRYLKLKPYIRYTAFVSLYIPTIYFFVYPLVGKMTMLENSPRENLLAQFSVWSSVLLVISWLIVVKLCRSLENEEEKNFLSIFDWLVTSVLVIYLTTFILNVRSVPHVGDYLNLLSNILVSLLPSLFCYYLYRYSYIEYVFKRGLIYTLLGFSIIVFYLSAISPFGKAMEKHLSINFRILQGILIMVMVFFFDTLKKKLLELFNRIFFRENLYFQTIISNLSKTINQVHMDIDDLLDYTAFSISRALKIRAVSIVIFREQIDKSLTITGSTLDIMAEDITEIINYLKVHKPRVLSRYHLREEDVEIFRQMKNIKAFNIIPIYQESELVGLLNIGKRPVRNHLIPEEEEMFLMLVNQIITTIENTKLAREKFALGRKMYESEKLSSLGRLSASIAHEVKNPLSSIKAITQVMKEDLPSDDSNQEGLGIIIQEIDRLSRVVNQLLHFARPRSYNEEWVDIGEVISNVTMLIKHNARRNNVEIVTNIKPIKLYCDQDALMEIFLNLTTNAIQCMPDGGKVEISSYEKKSKRHLLSYCVVDVSDNGPGISGEDRDKVFEPFYTTKQTGTGLGLAIVKRRLERIKGDIRFADNNPGTKFSVRIPLISPEERDQIEIDADEKNN
ncbi:ATP-binding protein [Candidatus Uabimicrobium sp. HlEnr_7]|uniref:ATP-binding protein n=1 Tax=Candidatus Uabimicrobium helgolandensis TaxID=3095367 RepID=UPI0035580DA9